MLQTSVQCLQCPHPECRCTNLYYQCPEGCIESHYLCDGEQHCSDKSDENYCHTKKIPTKNVTVKCADNKTEILASYVNDFISDCPGASDEEETQQRAHDLFNKVIGNCHYTRPSCAGDDQLPCVVGHSRCFPTNRLCVYDLDENGDLLYCRDGSHLIDCEIYNCLGMFKCFSMYQVLLKCAIKQFYN